MQEPFEIQQQKDKLGEDQEEDKLGCYSGTIHCCGLCCGFMTAWIPCCCFVKNPYQRVQQSYEGLIERFGKYNHSVKPGLVYVNPCTETIKQVDLKTQILDLTKQIALTRDNISVSIDASVYFKITHARRAIYSVANVSEAVRYLTFATLRNVVGQNTLQDLLEKRTEITVQILKYVDEHVEEWGVKIEQVFIKDILLSQDLQSSLSSAAKERRLAESKKISARADVEAAKMMREAADILSSKSAMQIRYLETIQQITKSQNSKIVFLPFDETAGTGVSGKNLLD